MTHSKQSNKSDHKRNKVDKSDKDIIKKPNRILNRKQPFSKKLINMAFSRLFTGNGSEADANIVLQEFDYMITTFKTTNSTPNGSLQPDPMACAWLAAHVNWVNKLHNNIYDGLNAEVGEELEEIDDGYEETIRGL